MSPNDGYIQLRQLTFDFGAAIHRASVNGLFEPIALVPPKKTGAHEVEMEEEGVNM
jgi:hypothetical protein